MVQRPSQKTEDSTAEEEPLQGGIVRIDFCRPGELKKWMKEDPAFFLFLKMDKG